MLPLHHPSYENTRYHNDARNNAPIDPPASRAQQHICFPVNMNILPFIKTCLGSRTTAQNATANITNIAMDHPSARGVR